MYLKKLRDARARDRSKEARRQYEAMDRERLVRAHHGLDSPQAESGKRQSDDSDS